jgi:hypothetical protein
VSRKGQDARPTPDDVRGESARRTDVDPSTMFHVRTSTVVSAGTVMFFVALTALVDFGGVASRAASPWVVSLASVVVAWWAVAVTIRTAWSFQSGSGLRVAWLACGLGIAMRGVGDIVWGVAWLSANPASLNHIGLWDLFYGLSYPLFCGGLVAAAMGLRKIARVGAAGVTASIATAGFASFTWVLLVQRMVFDRGLSIADRFSAGFYPMADIVLEVGPALWLLIVLSALGWRKVTWAWWWVGLGVITTAISDAMFASLQYTGGAQADGPWTYIWMLGFAFTAIGALVARDVQSVESVPDVGELFA